MISVTPDLKLTELRAPKFLLNGTSRAIFFVAFLLLNTIFTVTLSALSEKYLQSGDLALSQGLWMGLYVVNILVMIFWLLVMGYFSREFHMAVSERIKGIKAHLSEERDEFKMLDLSVKQVFPLAFGGFYLGLSSSFFSSPSLSPPSKSLKSLQVVRIFYFTLSLLPISVFYYLVIAFYDGFFLNAPFSKAFCVIFFGIAFLPLIFMIIGMFHV